MLYTAYKEQGLAKLNSNKDFIPISILFSVNLYFPKGLAKDLKTMVEEEEWKSDLLDCQKKRIDRLKKQSQRNSIHYDLEH